MSSDLNCSWPLAPEEAALNPAVLGVVAPGLPVVACVSHVHGGFRALEFNARAVATIARAPE